MRFLVIFIFLISNTFANETPNIENLIINKELKEYTNLTFLDDQNKIKGDKKKLKIFLKKYGHLRPGTYDISSLRYDQSYKNIFANTSNKKINKNKNQTNFYLNNKEKKKNR